MRAPRKVTPIVMAVALSLSVAACSGADKPGALPTRAVKTTAPATPTVPAPTTKAPEPGSVSVAGFTAPHVATAARFAERFALASMGTCSPDSLPALQSMMTPGLYKAALKQSPFILTIAPPTVLSAGCITSQKLSDGDISVGRVWNSTPTVRVAVTVTEDLKVSTKSKPKTLRPITVSRRYTMDVLPSGKSWLVQSVSAGDTNFLKGM